MQKYIGLIIFITVISPLAFASHEERSFLDSYAPIWRLIKTFTHNTFESEVTSRWGRRVLVTNRKKQDPVYTDFPCNLNITKRSKERPKSAHMLRPGDIDVVGAIGDSLTAGFGLDANSWFGTILHEGRGASFSIGGAETWRTLLTLPNILKNYNPNIYGHSQNSITTDRKSKFNVAEGGAISENMPYMAKVLVKRIKNDRNVNLEKDWKMITVFIGHNDFCSVNCYKQDFNNILQRHQSDMLDVLRIFRENLPRTVINFLPPIHLRLLLMMADKPPSCEIPQLASCPCLIGLPNRRLRSKMLDLITKWQQLDLEIANYKEFDRDDFTIITHRFTLNFELPLLSSGGADYGYVAPDCFHASQRGHAKAANELWNSLLEPYGRKSIDSVPEFQRFLCPTEDRPYIFTKRNSKNVF